MGLPLEGVAEDSTLKSQGASIHDHVQEGSDTCSSTKPDNTCSYGDLVGYKQGAATGPLSKPARTNSLADRLI